MWPFKKKELSVVKNEVVIQEEQFVFSTIDVPKKINNEYCNFTVILKSGEKFKSTLKSISYNFNQPINAETGSKHEYYKANKIIYLNEHFSGKISYRRLEHDGNNYIFEIMDGKSVQLPINQIDSIIFDEIQTEEVEVIDTVLVKNKKIENTTNG